MSLLSIVLSLILEVLTPILLEIFLSNVMLDYLTIELTLLGDFPLLCSYLSFDLPAVIVILLLYLATFSLLI